MSKTKKRVPEKGSGNVKANVKPEAKKADVKEEKKNPPAKVETKAAFVPKEVPDACQLVVKMQAKGKFGAYDGTSDSCKDCFKEFKKSAEACKFNTEGQAKVAAEGKAKSPRKPGAKRSGQVSPFGYDINSGAGKIDLLLLRKEGATMEEMMKLRGAVGSHLNAIKLKGGIITRKDGKYFAKLPAGAAKQ